MNKHSAVTENGEVLTRNSKTKVYSHVVVGYWKPAKLRVVLEANADFHKDQIERHDSDHSRKCLAEIEAEIAATYADDFVKVANETWSGSFELAHKNAASFVSKYGSAEMIPATVV